MAEGIFKSTMFGGFDKQDVLSYIEKIGRENKKEKDEVTERFESINLQKEKMATDFFALQERNKALEAELLEMKSAGDELKARNTVLANQTIGLKTALTDKDKQIETLKEEIKKVEFEINENNKNYEEERKTLDETVKEQGDQADFYKSKSERFDRLNENIDSIINQKKEQTKQIVNKVYNDTKKSSSNVKNSIANSVFRMESFQKEVRSLRSYMEDFNNDFIGQLDEMDKSVSQSIDEFDVDGSQLSGEIIRAIEEIVYDENPSRIKEDEYRSLDLNVDRDDQERVVNERRDTQDIYQESAAEAHLQSEDINLADESQTQPRITKAEGEIVFPISRDILRQKNSRLVQEEETVDAPNDILKNDLVNKAAEPSFGDINFFMGNNDN